jgi:hypothetical protein
MAAWTVAFELVSLNKRGCTVDSGREPLHDDELQCTAAEGDQPLDSTM